VATMTNNRLTYSQLLRFSRANSVEVLTSMSTLTRREVGSICRDHWLISHI